MRKLASIQRILDLEPIENADTLELATVLGWKVVVKKDQFKVGDWVIYCEVDSVLPDKPEFEFLRNKGMRIKTIRLRGQVSQGIVFPLSILPSLVLSDISVRTHFWEDLDVTELLEIKKYEPKEMSASLSGVAKGSFPFFIPKTDETRVQVLQTVLDDLKGTNCYITEKLDGSSVTFYLKDGEFGVCSRNLDLKEDDSNLFWKVAREMEIEQRMRKMGGNNFNYVIQGELIGEGVQGNKLQLKGNTVRFFNLYTIDKSTFLNFDNFESSMKHLGLETVPIISEQFKLIDSIDELVSMAKIKSYLNANVWAEGIVIRPLTEKRHRKIGRVSFKVINPEFLLKYD